MFMSEVEKIAEVCHEANRAYCRTIGDDSQLPWTEAHEWQKQSSRDAVVFRIANPDAPVTAQHEMWLADKRSAGWKWGPEKNGNEKEHPCMVPYEDLPEEQKRKDALFIAVVNALK
jgi:hypothetical protein